MDFFYDGQVRRYVTQFMRIFIGFKYRLGDGTEKHVPVAYGDMSRQVSAIISGNSENIMANVPKIACWISGLELDTSRLGDASFVSKLNLRERAFDTVEGSRDYKNYQGGGYTVERLMPTPFKLSLKAEIWTTSTDQKLQLLEQILVLFNPSLEIQTTDNYIDWTSLSVIDITNINFSSRTIPQGTESEIDICSIDFTTPIYISPPAKVKKLGIVKTVIASVFAESGQVDELQDLVLSQDIASSQVRVTVDQFGVLLIKNKITGYYDLSVLDVYEAVLAIGLENPPTKGNATRIDWTKVLELYGGYTGTSRIFFQQPNGYELVGTFTVNEADPTFLVIDLDLDTVPSNTLSAVTAIINPLKFNPIEKFGSLNLIPVGTRYLMLEDVNSLENIDGPDGWKNLTGDPTLIKTNSIIEWNGTKWLVSFDPAVQTVQYVTNLTSEIQYRWDGVQWLRSFEGEYAAGYWRFDLDA